MKNIIFTLFLFVAFCGFATDESYWKNAEEFREGVKIKKISLKEPRLIEGWMMRVDLKTPGIEFVTTERAKEWGQKMPDYTNQVKIIRTKREKTVDFMTRKRNEGHNLEIAINTAPWVPWCAPWTHTWAEIMHLAVSDGVVVCPQKAERGRAFFVVYKNGKVEITSKIEPRHHSSLAHVHPGFDVIAKNGVATEVCSRTDMHPRTAFGLSKDSRYLYLLVIDGRQKKYSLGARLIELYNIMLAAGASDMMNMDGGGSTSLVVYDKKLGGPRMLNHHRNNSVRKVALNLGISFKE